MDLLLLNDLFQRLQFPSSLIQVGCDPLLFKRQRAWARQITEWTDREWMSTSRSRLIVDRRRTQGHQMVESTNRGLLLRCPLFIAGYYESTCCPIRWLGASKWSSKLNAVRADHLASQRWVRSCRSSSLVSVDARLHYFGVSGPISLP
jgi:hypothetical protein